MELKKTKKADIERYRITAFLTGVVISLSLLFVAFEFSYGTLDDDIQPEQSDGLLENVNIMPVMSQQNMVALKEDEKKPFSNEILAAEKNAEPLQEVMNDDAVNGSDAENDKEDTVLDNPETAISPLASDMDDNPLNFHVVEDLPQFPGGAVEMMKWLTKNLKYPEGAQRRNKQGRVVAQFTVNVNGGITDIRIIKSVDPQLDREVMRVLRIMPAWTPGIQNGKPCRTRVVVPIWFRL